MALVIFGAIGVVHQQNEKGQINHALSDALNDSGVHGLPGLGFGGSSPEHRRRGNSVPVYCVSVYSNGKYYENDTSTAEMESDVAQAAITAVLDSNSTQGTLSDYHLFYQVQQTLTGSRIAFADTETYMESVLGFYFMLFGLWVVLMLFMFVITLFLSRLVTKPVSQAWETQQQFVADASHELKTPLTVIMADASILAADPDKTIGEQRQWIESISAEAERMQQLTEGMLTLAQADAGIDQTQLMSDIDFSELVEASLLQFEAVAFERGLILDEDIDEQLHVSGDKIRLEGLLKTLLENACKYSPKPGAIAIGLHAVKSNAVLTVHNAGDPIPEEDLPHLFDRFYRSDKSRVREGETASFGLGLSIAKSTAELHGGAIGAASGADGTTFTVTLPLVK